MPTRFRLWHVAKVLALIATAATSGRAQVVAASARTPAEQANADGGIMPFTRADVDFMQGMIAHHAQAVVMAGWAPSHGASPSLSILCQRIDVAQRDEIAFMQRWLRERKQTVPDANAGTMAGPHMAGMDMSGMPKLMPGMLSPQQMKQLDGARGTAFDQLFLTFMIQHHEGALTMVNTLFDTPGAGQELYVFRFASDVSADQETEIDRMHLMLSSLTGDKRQ